MKLEGIPANVVMGATGSGKTSFILQLLAQKPSGERWAVLVNDFGRATLDDVALAPAGLVVRAVAGCICCTSQVALRTALVALIRETRPRRLLVEASAAAEPESVLCVLREPGIASAIELGPTLTIFAGHQLSDARHAASEAYRKQLGAADVVLTRAASSDEMSAARARLVAYGLTVERLENADSFQLDALLHPR